VRKRQSAVEMTNNPIRTTSKRSMAERRKIIQGKTERRSVTGLPLILPHGWHESKTDDDEIFYYHDDGVTTTWDWPDFYPEGWEHHHDHSHSAVYDDEIISSEDSDCPEHEKGEDLLPGWNLGLTEDTGEIFYWHDDNESTSWDLPDWIPENWEVPTHYFVGCKPVGSLADGWVQAETEDNAIYYYNESTHEPTWVKPGNIDGDGNNNTR